MKIFLSYCWKDIAIAEAIDNDWQAVGITLTRDVRDMSFKQNIKEFMAKVTESDYALLIISKNYLESKNCMYEALEMFEHPQFKARVLPIVTRDARISDPLARLEYIEHWAAQIETLNQRLQQTRGGLAYTRSILAELDHYQKIRDSIDAFTDQMQAIKYAAWPNAKDENYAEIFQHIGYANSGLLEECSRILTLTTEEDQELALDELEEAYPNNVNIAITRSTVARNAGKYKKARKILEAVLPKAADVVHNRLGVLFAEFLREPALAKEQFERLLTLHPDDAYAHYNLGLLYTREFQEHTVACHHFERALALQPTFREAHTNLGFVLQMYFQDHDKARYHYEQSLALQPEQAMVHAYYARMLLVHFHEYDLAKQHAEHALRLKDDHADAHFTYAMLLARHFQQPTLACTHFQAALALTPEYAIIHYNYALTLASLQDYPQARHHLELTLEILQETDSALLQAGVLGNLTALLIEHFDERELVLSYCEQLLSLQFDHPGTYLNLGILLEEKLQESQLARQFLKKAVDMAPDVALLHYNLSVILVNNFKDDASAVPHLQQAIELQPDFADAHFLLAQLLVATDQLSAAVSHYQQAVALDPKLRRPGFDELADEILK